MHDYLKPQIWFPGISSAADLIISLAVTAAACAGLALLWTYIRSPVKSFPGPFTSNFTNFQRLLDVHSGEFHLRHRQLHRKYGSAVRMGPNTISLSDPELINTVYRTREPWKKGPMYPVNDVVVGRQRFDSIFSTVNEIFHAAAVRPIKPLYSMTKVREFEPNVDTIIDLLLQKLDDRFVDQGAPCDMAEYLKYLAWDTMSQITFSAPLGILEDGNDDRKYLESSRKNVDYFARVSQVPTLDAFLDKNSVYRIGPPGLRSASIFAMEALGARTQSDKGPFAEGGKVDLLGKFLEAKNRDPETVTDHILLLYLLANLVAGSDTTAITMTSVIYHVLKHPSVQRNLEAEIRDAQLSIPVSWKDSQQLPYLDAVIKESLRVHPSNGLMLERVVPEGGLTLRDGSFIPKGTVVGLSPWIIGQDHDIYGSAPERFIPERWLKQENESEEHYQARFSRMKAADLTFGSGPRACLGRSITQLEVYKTIATLFAKYDMELADPDAEWEVYNVWFVYQFNVPVVFRSRV